MSPFPLPGNYFDGGARLSNQGKDDLVEALNLIAPNSKVWPFQSNQTVQYAGGFYDFAAADDDFSPSISWGTAGVAVAAHFSIILGGTSVGTLLVKVSGTSISDSGDQVTGASETIVVPAGTKGNAYFETSKKWNGQISVEVIGGTPIAANYGWAKYHDFGNTNFIVTGLEALWASDSTDGASDIALLHHKATGWVFNAGAVPTPPPVLASFSGDNPGMTTLRVGPGAWKRANLRRFIEGADSEGILFCVTSGSLGVGALSFRALSLEVEVTKR